MRGRKRQGKEKEKKVMLHSSNGLVRFESSSLNGRPGCQVTSRIGQPTDITGRAIIPNGPSLALWAKSSAGACCPPSLPSCPPHMTLDSGTSGHFLTDPGEHHLAPEPVSLKVALRCQALTAAPGRPGHTFGNFMHTLALLGCCNSPTHTSLFSPLFLSSLSHLFFVPRLIWVPQATRAGPNPLPAHPPSCPVMRGYLYMHGSGFTE